MDQEQVGKFIKELRIKNNLTQRELADKLNVTFQAVSKWENGKSIPDIAQLKEISNMFDVNIEELLNGKKDNKKNNTNKKLWIIPIVLIIIGIIVGVIVNRNINFSFKKITTYDTSFSVTGSLAYDSKGKIYIYITDIDYDNDDDKVYKKVKVSLYEDYKGKSTKIRDCEEEGKNISIKEHLENISFNIDDYKSSCDDLTKSSFYLEVETTNDDNTKLYYKIPLVLEDICPIE